MAKHANLVHPGEILKEEFLIPHNVSANQLALRIGVPPNRIAAIVNGERSITGETAILLGRAFATSPEFWLNLQAHYDLEVARAEVPRDRIRKAEALAKELCLA